jgi:hypothetical protein
VSILDVIFYRDSTGSIGIIVSHNFNSIILDFITRPSTWAISTFNWGITISVTETSTVIISPFVFTFFNTFENFTVIDVSVSVHITFSEEEFIVINIDVIT